MRFFSFHGHESKNERGCKSGKSKHCHTETERNGEFHLKCFFSTQSFEVYNFNAVRIAFADSLSHSLYLSHSFSLCLVLHSENVGKKIVCKSVSSDYFTRYISCSSSVAFLNITLQPFVKLESVCWLCRCNRVFVFVLFSHSRVFFP